MSEYQHKLSGQQAKAITAGRLQREIAADLETLFKNDRFQTPDGKQSAPKAYAQFLPRRESDDAEDPFPYLIVRVESGGVESPAEPHEVVFTVIIGIYNDNPANNGHFEVLEIIERIQLHYAENPCLGAAVESLPFHYALQDEESYPYFIGACSLTFHLPAPQPVWSDLT